MRFFEKLLGIVLLCAVAVSLPFVCDAKNSSYYDVASKHYDKGDFSKAFDAFQKAADEGDNRADFELGVMYLYGRGIPLDDGKAFNSFEKAAKKGNLGGVFMLGRMYIEGIGTKQDKDKAIAVYTKAADAGKPFFQYLLGEYYADGVFVSKDMDKALALLEKAAEGGSGYAALRLAEIYEDETFDGADGEKAARYYIKAAKLGIPKAIFKTGYVDDNNLKSGENAAKKSDNVWILRKSGEGDERALYELAQVYNHIKAGKTFNWSRKNSLDNKDVSDLTLDRISEVNFDELLQSALIPLIVLNILVIFIFSWFNIRRIKRGKISSKGVKSKAKKGKSTGQRKNRGR